MTAVFPAMHKLFVPWAALEKTEVEVKSLCLIKYHAIKT
jgi:hypothetical protein